MGECEQRGKALPTTWVLSHRSGCRDLASLVWLSQRRRLGGTRGLACAAEAFSSRPPSACAAHLRPTHTYVSLHVISCPAPLCRDGRHCSTVYHRRQPRTAPKGSASARHWWLGSRLWGSSADELDHAVFCGRGTSRRRHSRGASSATSAGRRGGLRKEGGDRSVPSMAWQWGPSPGASQQARSWWGLTARKSLALGSGVE